MSVLTDGAQTCSMNGIAQKGQETSQSTESTSRRLNTSIGTARWLQRNLGLASKDSLHRATYQGDYTWWFMFVEVQIAVSLA